GSGWPSSGGRSSGWAASAASSPRRTRAAGSGSSCAGRRRGARLRPSRRRGAMAEAPGVLLVEDSESDVFFFRQAMKKVGASFPLRTAADGEAALDYLSGAPPPGDRGRSPLPLLTLLDLKIPKRSGFEVLERIRSDPRLQSLRVLKIGRASCR